MNNENSSAIVPAVATSVAPKPAAAPAATPVAPAVQPRPSRPGKKAKFAASAGQVTAAK
jgi:hypothetical protein